MAKYKVSRRAVFGFSAVAVMALAGCAQDWQTSYTPVASQARNWNVTDVRVSVPSELTVSESHLLFVPNADIVWQEEPQGDRYAQVAAIVDEGVSAAARTVSGSKPVRFDVVVRKFHALSTRALRDAPTDTGVENVQFDIQVVDARTGAVILPYQTILAEFPGLVGQNYNAALARGESQRMRIVSHINSTVRGWLGTGPDNRTTFNRAGG